jgi:predicted KAP-like P-loop ATPase
MKKKQLIRLTESDLHRIIENSVDKYLQQQEHIKKWKEEEYELYNEFVKYLQYNGIKARLHEFNSGAYAVAIPSNIEVNIYNIGNKFAKNKNKSIRVQDYPAVTYVHLCDY